MFLAMISITEFLAVIGLVIGVFTAIAAIVVIRNTKLKIGLLISFGVVIIGSIIVLLRIAAPPQPVIPMPGPITEPAKIAPIKNLDQVLLVIEESDGTIASSLSEALRANGLHGIRATELASENAIQFKDALERLLAGQMNAGSTIPYVVVVKGELSIHSNQPLEDFAKEPYYNSTAGIELQAIDTRNGKSRRCNISGVLGQGKTENKATSNALQKTSNRIKPFAKEIASMIR
ncbi:MAG TPA: hypothetical protein VN937_05560 [Blastocatellia bacterium]|nr:hypothetical protein [Blastocatellia bacterium]